MPSQYSRSDSPDHLPVREPSQAQVTSPTNGLRKERYGSDSSPLSPASSDETAPQNSLKALRNKSRLSAPDLPQVENYAVDMEGMRLNGMDTINGGNSTHDKIIGLVLKYLMWVVAIGPWKVIRGMSWVLNKWQRLVSPVSIGIFHAGDAMDKSMPTVRVILVWLWNTLSLALHFVDVILIFTVIRLLSGQGHGWVALIMGLLYFTSHYLMAVIMFMEHDRPADTPTYTLADPLNFLRRQVDVLFFDIQLFASVIHSNQMLEGMTQFKLQGYEEARVCLHFIINTLPSCIILGVLYDAIFAFKDSFQNIIEHKGATQQIYAAFALAILNAVEKFIRVSFTDPWLHPANKDGYPLLYMRSDAARLPRALMLDFLFRCNVQLVESDDKLQLKPLYDKYTVNCRGTGKELADGHKMYLLRKALRTLNGKIRPNRAETIARKIDQQMLRDQAMNHTRTIRSIDASNLHPGPHMAGMLEDVLAEATGFESLNLADNAMSDSAVKHVMEGLRHNVYGLQIKHLDLSGNDVNAEGCEAIATYMVQFRCMITLNLSNNTVTTEGVKALATALNEDTSLYRLDLTNCTVGPEGAAALGAMLKANRALRELVLVNTKMTSPGVESLTKGLIKNTTLKELDISKTATDDKAAAALAQALQSNRALQRLNLGRTKITDVGAKILCDALQDNTTLQFIDTTDCPMDKSWKRLLSNIMKQGATDH